jgi:Cu(I)/Ag(I) efflux system membrane fusion protein
MADMQGMQGVPGMAGMDMTGSGTVKLTAEQMGQFGVTFGSVEVRPLTAEVRTAGAIMVDETRVVQVAPRFGGFAERLYVDFTGQPVRRGQPLLEVYSPELVTAEEELLVASRLQREMGQSTVPGLPANAVDLLASAKRRLELWDISEEQIAEILRTGRVRRTLTLFAPAAGTVMEKRIVQGQAFATGEPLYTIANLETVWVEAQLREADATSVRFGSHAEMAIAGLPGRAFEGHVQFVYPTLDSVARAIRARIIVPNPDGLLKPGMYATVRLATPMRSALTVPTSAVLRTGERNLVFVDLGGGELRPQEVALGVVTGDYTEVLTGLEPGQRVVTSAQFLLDSESNLGEVMKAMLGQMPSGDARSMQDVPGMAAPGRR